MDRIKVTVKDNIFSNNKKVYYSDRKSIGEILKDNNLKIKPNIIVIDNDKKIYGKSKIPKSDHLIINVMPTGNRGVAWGEKIAGAALVIVGIVLSVVSYGTLTAGTAALIGTGVSLIIGGIILYNQNFEVPGISDGDRKASISGAQNQTRKGQGVPILLGQHRIYPDNLALPYVKIGSDSRQTLYQIFCGGYDNQTVDEDTLKIGDTLLSDYNDINYDIKQGGTNPFTYYEGRRVDATYNTELIYTEETGILETVKTTSTNCRAFNIRFVFPQGLIRYRDDGDARNASVGILVEYKGVDEDDEDYKSLGEDVVVPSTGSSGDFTYTIGDTDIVIGNTPLYNKINAGATVTTTNGNLPGGTTVLRKYVKTIYGQPTTYENHFELTNGFTASDSDTILFSNVGAVVERGILFREKTNDTYRYVLSKTLDNLTGSDPDYNPTRQYNIRVKRVTIDTKSVNRKDDVYLESIKSTVGDFSSGFDDNPVIDDFLDDITALDIEILATNQLQGAIQQINYIGTVEVRIWDEVGTGPTAWTTETTSRNPASMFLYAATSADVNRHAISDDNIDWEKLEEWYTFCKDKDFYCDAFVNQDITLFDLLNYICSTGRASWSQINDTYTVIPDKEISEISQMFTPRNTKDYSFSINLPDKPTGLRVKYIDADIGYQEREIVVYKDAEDDSNLRGVTLWGVTNSDQAWKLAKYMLACTELRPIVHTFNVDYEYLVSTRGDRLKFQHDVALEGLTSGRILAAIESGGNTTGFVSDQVLTMEAATTYAVRIRLPDGTFLDEALNNPGAGDYNTVTFTTPITGTGIIGVDKELFTYGETDLQDEDLIIQEISPNDDQSARLVCVEYAPDVFDADTGVIPDYTPSITNPGSSGGSIDTSDIKDVDNQVAIVQEDISSAVESLTAKYPDSYVSNTDNGYYMGQDDTYVYYVNYDHGSLIYKKLKDKVSNGIPITSDISGTLDIYDTSLLYSNLSNSGVLYKKSTTDISNGTAITTDIAWRPQIDDVGNCYYINMSNDNNIYVTDILGDLGGNGTVLITENVVWFTYAEGKIYYSKSDGNVIEFDISDSSETTLISSPVMYFDNLDDEYLAYTYPLGDVIYSRLLDGTGSESELFLYGDYIDGNEGDLLYTAPTVSDGIYTSLLTSTVDLAVLEATPEYNAITGTITNTSNLVADVDILDMDRIAQGDFVIANGIPDGTTITLLGTNFFYMSANATATTQDLEIEISGSRLFLNANKVIVKNTIEAPLLTASAVDSKARTAGGYKKSVYNLDEGTILLRADDDTIVFDFDPDRTDNELELTGTIQSSNYVEGETGWTIDQDGDAEFNTVTIRGEIGSGIGLLGVNWSGVTEEGTALTIATSGVMETTPLTRTSIAMFQLVTGSPALRTYSWDGSTWGQTGNTLTLSGVNSTGISALNETTIALVDVAGDELITYEWDGTDWSQLGNALSIIGLGGAAITTLNDTDVVIINQGTNSFKTYEWDGTDWSQIGNSLTVTLGFNTTATTLTSTTIAMYDSSGQSLKTYEWDGTDWSQLGNSYLLSSAQIPTITALNTTDIALYEYYGHNIDIYRFDGNDWVLVTPGGTIDISGTNPVGAISALNGTDISFVDNVNLELRYYRFGLALSVPRYFQT